MSDSYSRTTQPPSLQEVARAPSMVEQETPPKLWHPPHSLMSVRVSTHCRDTESQLIPRSLCNQ